MGCVFSCKKLPSSSKSSKEKNIRIVHLNGYVEEFDYPVAVAELTGNPPKHFLFTQVQLLSAGSTPLKQDTVLESGRVYFLLPYSLFESNVSPVDLAPIARKLGSMARSRSKYKSANHANASSSTPVSSSPGRNPKRVSMESGTRRVIRTEAVDIFCGTRTYSKSKSWKPILDPIREKSFNQKNELDLQENVKVEISR